MKFTDPFSGDTSKYRALLNKDEHKSEVSDEIPYADATEILDSGTDKGFANTFKKLKGYQEQVKTDPKIRQQVEIIFSQLLNDVNKKYGLDLPNNFESVSTGFTYIIDPKNQKAMEYVISMAYSKFRVVMYGQFLNAIAILSAQILDPQYLLSDSMTYDQKLETMSKLFEFLGQVEEVYEKVRIPDTEMKLEKLSTTTGKNSINLNDERIRNFMDDFFNSIDKNKKLSDSKST